MADDLVTGSDGLGGLPGDRWRNPTDRVWWQWVSSLRKPCAVCLRRHGRLFPGPDPPERPHPHCECGFIEVRPGAQVELVSPLNWLIRSASPRAGRSVGLGPLGK